MLSIIPDLDKHPTTYAISEQLGVSLHTAIGYAVAMHGFLAKHGTRNGRKLVIPHGTPERIDTILGITGLTQALIDTGLVTDDLDFAQFTNYLLGKKLTPNAKRQAKHRESKKNKGVTPTVTQGVTPEVTDAEVVAETPAAPVVTPAVQVVEAELVTAKREPRGGDPRSAAIPPSLDTEEFRDAWESWITDRSQRGKRMTHQAATLQLLKLSALTPAEAVRCIADSIANGWQGLFPEKYRGGGYQTAAERTEEIQRRLGAELLAVEP